LKNFYILLVDDEDSSGNQTAFEFPINLGEHLLTNAVVAFKVE
jgi:hypothetical protein